MATMDARRAARGQAGRSIQVTSNAHYLRYDTWIRATYKLLDYVVETAQTWDQMPDYRKEGRLMYLNQLDSYLFTLQFGERLGNLTKAQIRQLRNLERLGSVAKGTIKALQDEYEASKMRRVENHER